MSIFPPGALLPQLLDREADRSLIAHGNLKANTVGVAEQYRRRIVLPKKGIRPKAQITHTKDPEILVLLNEACTGDDNI